MWVGWQVIAVMAGIAVGAIVGLINGFVIAYLGVCPSRHARHDDDVQGAVDSASPAATSSRVFRIRSSSSATER